jgi:hypothetical protein
MQHTPIAITIENQHISTAASKPNRTTDQATGSKKKADNRS